MSLKAGLAALNLEDSEMVARTEYSADTHWELIKRTTGINTDIFENRNNGTKAFIKNWDYSFMWSAVVHKNYLERFGKISNMGHAVYSENASGKADKDENVFSLFKDVESALKLDCTKVYGEFDRSELIKTFNESYFGINSALPDLVNMGGSYITLMSGLTYIYGWEMLLECMAYDEFSKVIESYYEWVKQFFIAYAKSDVPVVMVHDDICWSSGQFASNEFYNKNIFPYLKSLIRILKDAGKRVLFTTDGDFSMFFDKLVDCGGEMFFFEPTANMELFAKKYGKTHGFVGNIDTKILLYGDKESIFKEVKRVMDFGKKYKGFVLAVGNHIPSNTPVENALYYNEAYLKYGKR